MRNLFLVLLLLATIAGCSHVVKHNTTSYIKIFDKGTYGNQFWIEVEDPNSLQRQRFKIQIKDENVWNLIEESQEYFATYEYTDLNRDVSLIQIKRSEVGK